MKIQRHAMILDLIQKNNIETQEELTDRLNKAGFNATQATVSRDIKELRISKVTNSKGHYKYAVNIYNDEIKVSAKFKNILCETVIHVDCSSSLAIIKTFPGMAQAAASAIDNMNFDCIVGTIAGDDTIFVALHNDKEAMNFVTKFRNLLSI